MLAADQYRQPDQHRPEQGAEHQFGPLGALGTRLAGAPLAMASIPVRAEQPAAKAFRISIAPIASLMRIGCGLPTTAAGWERAKWGGVSMQAIVDLVRPRPEAKWVVFYSLGEGADKGIYYDAHPD